MQTSHSYLYIGSYKKASYLNGWETKFFTHTVQLKDNFYTHVHVATVQSCATGPKRVLPIVKATCTFVLLVLCQSLIDSIRCTIRVPNDFVVINIFNCHLFS